MNNTLYQVGRLDEFVGGKFGGITTAAEVLKHGDTGMGTFEGGDGEMIILEGKMYQALEDFSVVEVAADAPVPLANIIRFEPQLIKENINGTTMAAFSKTFEEAAKDLPGEYVLLLAEGTFSSITVRSEKGQKPPYKPLEEFLAYAQRETMLENVEGILMGLYCPPGLDGINAEGWHYHFITADRTLGGHVLEMAATGLKTKFDSKEKLVLGEY